MNSAQASRFAAFALVFALYSATMCRWIGAGDTAIVVQNIHNMILSTHVNNHAGMVVIGWLFDHGIPFGSVAWRVNWLSVVVSALYVGLLFPVIVWRILPNPVHMLLATAFLTVTHTVWWHATIVENYALNGLALLAVTLLLLRELETGRALYLNAAAVVGGIAMFNHAQMGFLIFTLGGYAILREPRPWKVAARRVAITAAWWWVGAIPYVALFVYKAWRSHQAEAVARDAIGGQFTSIMFDLQLDTIGTVIYRELIQQWPSPLLLLVLVGPYFAFKRDNPRRRVHLALLAGWLVNTVFFLMYNTWDRYAFLLPSYVLMVLWGVEAWGAAFRRTEGRARARAAMVALALASIAMHPLMFREFPRLGREGLFWPGRFSSNSQWNTHDVASYLANPDKSRWDDLAVLNEQLMEKLPPRSIVIDDDGRNHYTLELYYVKLLQIRRDIRPTLVNAWGFDNWGTPKDQLKTKVPRWVRSGVPVYAMGLMAPHREWIEQVAEEGLGPVPEYLDDDRWIYRFHERPRGAAGPFVFELMTGVRMRKGTQLITHRFGPGDAPELRVRFRKHEEGEEHTVIIRYTGPGGETFDQAVALKEKQDKTVVEMPPEVMATVGTWQADSVYEGQVDTFIRFRVEPEPVDRRFR